MSNYVINYKNASHPTGAPVGSLTKEQILEQCIQQWPELAGATVNVDGNVVTFTRPTGTKQA